MRKPAYITNAKDMIIAPLKTNNVSVRIVLMSDIDLALLYVERRGSSKTTLVPSSTGSVFETGTHFSAWLNPLAVSFSRQPSSRTIIGHPTSGGLFVQKVELQNAEMDGSPFSLVQRPDEVSASDLALPVKECAVVDRDLLLGPQMSG